MLLAVVSVAFAFQQPNSVLGVTVGAGPEGEVELGGRGEAWLADELSVELGVTTPTTLDRWTADAAVRWRPDVLCLACEERALVSFGVGVGGFVVPDVTLEGPWSWTVGPDLAATFVYWAAPSMGLSVCARGGFGGRVVGEAIDDAALTGWGYASVGLAF